MLNLSCENDFYLLGIKIDFRINGFALCLVLKERLVGNSGMARRFVDKHWPNNHSFHLLYMAWIIECWIVDLAPVVQTLDRPIHWINHYTVDKY